MPTLKASVQYDDWRGSAAADDAHDTSIRELLRDKGAIADGEYVVAIEFYTGENFEKPSVRAVIADGTGYDDVKSQLDDLENLSFRQREVDLSLEEFFALFKRFSIVLTSRDLGLEGRDYREIDG